jgi:NDP-sugar pyrophosphorylase family protein
MTETAVMLLAAGRSTRLGPLGLALPKPLVPICGYPAIRFGLAASARAGFREAVVNLHHLGDRLRDTLGDGEGGLRVRYSVEIELLGTGGGIAHARGLLGGGRVLVINGKVVADIDLRDFLGGHVESGAEGSLLLRDDPDPRKWGAIGVDASGRVVSILTARSPIPPEGPVTERMFTGIHVMEPALLDRLRPAPCDVIRDAYMPALEAGARIAAQRLDGYFAEHSTPERYLAGNLDLLHNPSLVPHPPGPLTGIAATAQTAGARLIPPYRIAAGAVVEPGAEIGPGAVIGAHAQIRATARIRNAVVWQDTVVDGELEHAVATPEGVVAVADPSP